MIGVVLAMMVAPAEASAQTPAAVKDDPIVCRRKDSEVGTHLRPKPVCLRKSEWDLVEKNTQRELQRLQEKHLDPGMAQGH